jgi:hypothetical protein
MMTICLGTLIIANVLNYYCGEQPIILEGGASLKRFTLQLPER